MRLDKVYIDGFKNLDNVAVDFDESKLTSVVIGQNGSGKSNLIEAIVDVFRYVDLNRGAPRFTYRVEYRIGQFGVVLANEEGKATIDVDGNRLTRKAFDENRTHYFPDLIFGYYSGGGRKLEKLFDSHQRRYYDVIKVNENEAECKQALLDRRLFYCRPIHGVLALLSFFAFPDSKVAKLLGEKIGIAGFDSALALFKEPWYAKGSKAKKIEQASSFWGAKGPAGKIANQFRSGAFHPLTLTGNAIDDYRDKLQAESQFACFIKDIEALQALIEGQESDADLFYALEAADISDLIRDIFLWIKRIDNDSGDVGFNDLSDGERQLLMVLGLLRVSRGKRALFLLDEPDIHLNPAWQHAYLELIRDWTGQTADSNTCHIILTSHNPLTIAALEKSEVRVMQSDDEGRITVKQPYADPRGLGFTATLTEIFGLPTTLDPETQKQIDERNTLARIEKRSQQQEQKLIEINDKLNRLGFMFEDREPLYHDFLRAWQDVRYADKTVLNQEQIASRQAAMGELIKKLTEKAVEQ